MKPATEHNPLQQLNLMLTVPTAADVPDGQQSELEAALAELLLTVARAWIEPRQGDSDEPQNHR